MLAKANYPLSLHLRPKEQQKLVVSLSREDDCKAAREKISCAEKLRTSKILTTANQNPREREERERKRERESM